MSDEALDHFVFSHKVRAVYAPVPKAACSSVKAYLRQIEGLPPASLTVIHDRARSGLNYAVSLDPSALIVALFSKHQGYFRFTVVRNPFTRLVSAYRDLLEPRGGGVARFETEREAILAVIRKRYDLKPSESRTLSFEAFVSALPLIKPSQMNRHWRPQYAVTLVDLIPFDMIVQIEQLPDHLGRLAKRLGSPTKMEFYLNRSGDDIVLADWYTRQTEDIVARIYARDFRRFKYEPSIRRGSTIAHAEIARTLNPHVSAATSGIMQVARSSGSKPRQPIGPATSKRDIRPK